MLIITIWVITLGLVGLIFGSYVPFLLDANPGNMQPIVGIFITGPLGALLGAGLGTVAEKLRVPSSRKWWLFLGAVVLFAGGIVTLTVPYYRFSTWLIDGEVVACKDAQLFIEPRQSYWQQEHARVMKGETEVDRANAELTRQRGSDVNWEQEVNTVTRRRPGVVLTVHVIRNASVYEARWTTGHVSRRVEWKDMDKKENFFSEQQGSSCEGYGIGQRAYYQSNTEAWDRYPPRNLPAFLGLSVLTPLAETYRSMLSK